MAVQALTLQDVYGPRSGRMASTSATATPGATAPAGRGFARAALTPQERGATNGMDFTASASSKPLYGVAVLAALLVGLSLLAQRVGSTEEFREVRLSVYNVIVIGLAAIVGILFWKVLFTRFPVPHITPAVLAV